MKHVILFTSMFQAMKPFVFLLLVLLKYCCAANILGAILHTSISHQIAFRSLWRELSLRGHKVTVLTSDPMNDPTLTNLNEIDLSVAYNAWRSTDIVEYSERSTVVQVIYKLMEVGENVLKVEMAVPGVQELLNNKNISFDLVIAEPFYPLAMAFSHKFDCPLVMALSQDGTTSMHEAAGNFAHPLLFPSYSLPFDHPLNLFQRTISVVSYFAERFIGNLYMKHYTEVARKYFGEDLPDLIKISSERARLNIFYLNPAFGNVRPMAPATIAIGGTHIEPLKPLPNNLKHYLDSATDGLVYFSLGSNHFSRDLSIERRNTFMEAFAELPFKVLWKFEGEILEDLPKNIKLAKWVPQQDILRHPNVKVFITQGGMQSIEEALAAQVPLIVMPKMVDQHYNARRAVNKGMGLRVNCDTITKNEFKETILEVANNSRYRKRMVELNEFAKDQPIKPLDKAIFWIEYVIRHNNTQHLKGVLSMKRFYNQIFDFDVIFSFSLGFLIISIFLWKIFSLFFSKIKKLI